jgi:hypothetical protein
MKVVPLTVMLATPLATKDAQQPVRVQRIGVVAPTSPHAAAPFVEAFRAGLRDVGYTEGAWTLTRPR